MAFNKAKILFATPVLHHPPVGGPTLRIENAIKALSTIADVCLYCRLPVNNMGGPQALRFYQRLCHRVVVAKNYAVESNWLSFIKRAANKILTLCGQKSVFHVYSAGEPENYPDVIEAAKSFGADLIWLGYGNISYPLMRYIKEHSDIPVVLDTDSVWSRFLLRGMPYAKTEVERKRIEHEGKAKEEEERWGTLLSDITTAVSDVDAGYYNRLAAQSGKVMIFSNVIDVQSYRHAPTPAPGTVHPNIYIAGTFWPGGSPMEHATRWVIDEVFPDLCLRFPNVQFNIVGKNSHLVFGDINVTGVRVLGEVPSVLPYLCHADVVLVPLKYESGTRFKILEAGACGRAVVSTTLGAEGIPITHGKDILIADDAQAFVDAVTRIILDADLGCSLGANLKKLVEEKYSLRQLEAEGFAIINKLARLDAPRNLKYSI